MQKKPTYRLDNLQSVRRYLAKLIHDYRRQSNETVNIFDDTYIPDGKFKNLVYGLNSLAKILEQSNIEQRLDEIEASLKNE